jgi:DNA repair protein RecO (recombination protein O)
MEWQDEGFILHTQSLGERKQVISLFTAAHGRCAGVLYVSQKNKGWVQCGGKVKARWGARLENHIGSWTLESLQANTAYLLDAPGPLAALLSAASLCQIALPERHAYPQLYERFEALIKDLIHPTWARSYVFFELSLLEELGYGLDLKTCAVTGSALGLNAVSPRTGRAVCEEAAKPYKDKLLPLPAFICQENRNTTPEDKEILDALTLSGYFLERYLLGHTQPAARMRLVQRFSKVRKSA